MKSNNKKNFVWNTIGLTFYSFVSLFLLVVVKRINGMDNAGIFTYSFSLSTLFFYISLYFNRSYQIANYNNDKNFNQLFSTRIVFSVISLLLIISFSLINEFDLFKILIIILLMLFRICDAISDTFYGYEQENNYLYKSGISYTLKSIIGFLSFLVIDIITNNLVLSCLFLFIINLFFMFFYDYINYKKISNNKKIILDFSNIRLIIYEAFPIFVFSFLNIYLANSQKYILNYYVSNEVQSLFGILIMPATMLSLVGSYLIVPFTNTIKKLYTKKRISELHGVCNKILMYLFLIGMLGLVVCYFIGIPVLNIIYGINIWEYRNILEVVILGSIFASGSMIISNILILLNDNKVQIVFYLIGSIFSSVLSILLIIKKGINGAIIAYMFSYIMVYVLFYIRYKSNIKKIK